MLPYALTIFSSAFLLFQIQPLIGKYILPWFGGGPGVWTTCLLFFQLVLLAGYAYAHLSARLLRPRAQALLHGLLLLGALVLQPIIPAERWQPVGDVEPVARILLLLTATLGLPYFVLSATGPLVQQWFNRAQPGVSPYRLYALSNVGSLLALLSYPVFFEVHFTRREQAWLWGAGLLLHALACGWCAVKTSRGAGAVEEATTPAERVADERPTVGRRLLWLLWPACASVLLLATTNKMCQDVAVIPFLWVLPLALYLVSFIVAFDNPRWYSRTAYVPLLVAALAGITWALFRGTDVALPLQVGLYSGGLLVCCLVCHGELYRLRPAPSRLTGFYLTVSAGGALGGMLVGLAAPAWFDDFWELHGGLVACATLFTVVCFRDRTLAQGAIGRIVAVVLTVAAVAGLGWLLEWGNRRLGGVVPADKIAVLRWGGVALAGALALVAWRWPRSWLRSRLVVLFWLAAGTVDLTWALVVQAREDHEDMIFRARNFYGTLAVLERDRDFPEAHHVILQHGRITHGLQLRDPAQARLATSYYGPHSGIGLALAAVTHPERHVGVVGLGTGTIAALGQPGDRFRLYEINPTVIGLARTTFTYLRDSAAKVEVVRGDARLSLERETPQGFDVLALDAFSSDAIPVHLLTKEAMALYGRHLRPEGVIAVHISNRYLDLEPVVRRLAQEFGYGVATIAFEDDDESYDDLSWWDYSSTWMLLTKDKALLAKPEIRKPAEERAPSDRHVPLWTDDFASLFQILN